MPTSVETIARSVLAAIDSDAGLLLAAQWTRNRYRQLVSRSRFRHLRRIGEVIVPGTVDTGLASATRGSKTVTGDAAAQGVWTSALVGRAIRLRTSWYEIDTVSATPDINLKTAFAEDDATNVSYDIVDRKVALADNVRWLGTLVHMRRRLPLEVVSLSELDGLAPDRNLVSASGPRVVAEIAEEGGSKRLEFYPYPEKDEVIRFVFWQEPLALTNLSDTVPDSINPETIKEGVMIDAMRFNAARAAKAANVELAAFWRNEYRAQQTTWERSILEAIKTDRGIDDMQLILSLGSKPTRGLRDVQTAHDDFLASGRTIG